METSALLNAHVQLKRAYTALNEALDLTRQLGEAAPQVGLNQRILKQLVDLDRVVNRKLTREKSIYQ